MKIKKILAILGLVVLLTSSTATAFAGSNRAPSVNVKTVAQNSSSTSQFAVDTVGNLWSYSSVSGGLGSRTQVGAGWTGAKQIISADWNSDGSLDIVARWANGNLTVTSGYGNNVYGQTRVIGTGWADFSINVAFLKRSDSFPGVIARNSNDGNLYYYPNSYGGSLDSIVPIGTGWGAMTELNAVDFDQDGAMDIVARNSIGQLYLYRTNGLGQFVSEYRANVGTGWNVMNSITVKKDLDGPGSIGLIGKTNAGQLFYYGISGNRISSTRLVGIAGWNGYSIAPEVSTVGKASYRGVYETAYANKVYDHVSRWCPQARVTLNHPSITGNIYGMTWWASDELSMRSDIPESITKQIALHECGHLLQAKAYKKTNRGAALDRLNAIYGTTGTAGMEANADCISAYLSPYSYPFSMGSTSQSAHWATRCSGEKGEAAKRVIDGYLP